MSNDRIDIPRERKEQKQFANLVLRNNTHRELIYNDQYHNAVYIGKDSIASWRKFKKHTLLGTSYGIDNVWATSIDMEHLQATVQNVLIYMHYVPLKDYIVAYYPDGAISQYKGIYISKYGYDFQYIDIPRRNWIKYGNSNSLMSTQVEGNYIVFYKTTIKDKEPPPPVSKLPKDKEQKSDNKKDNEEKVILYEVTTTKMFSVLKNSSSVFCLNLGQMGSGALIYLNGQEGFHKVTDSGITRIQVFGDAPIATDGRYSVYHNGINVVPSYTYGNNKSGCSVIVFKNDGTESAVYGLTLVEHWPNYLHNTDVIWRNGYFWMYCRHYSTVDNVITYRYRIFKTVDFSEITEVLLPDYVDVDVTENSPFSTEYTKVRLIFRSNAVVPDGKVEEETDKEDSNKNPYGEEGQAIDQSNKDTTNKTEKDDDKYYKAYAYIGRKSGNLAQVSMNFATSIVDGKYNESIPGICITTRDNEAHVVFDNMELKPSKGNYAYFTTNYDEEYGEDINEEDYVFGGIIDGNVSENV